MYICQLEDSDDAAAGTRSSGNPIDWRARREHRNLKVSREDFKSFAKCLKSTHSKARIQVCRFVEYI